MSDELVESVEKEEAEEEMIDYKDFSDRKKDG